MNGLPSSKTIAVGVAGLGAGAALGYFAGLSRSSSKRSRKRSSYKTSRKKSRRNRLRKQKKPYTAGKRRDTSRRRIRYTKNNQPYIIMANGRARFISKRSVRSSRKRQGGRY